VRLAKQAAALERRPKVALAVPQEQAQSPVQAAPELIISRGQDANPSRARYQHSSKYRISA
jgi:hypothetical protein